MFQRPGLTLVFFAGFSALAARDAVMLPADLPASVNIAPAIGVYADTSGLRTLKQVRREARFERHHGHAVHFGFTPNTYWFHFRYSATAENAQPVILGLGNYALHFVDFYLVRGGKVIGERHTGAARPFAARFHNLREFTLPLPRTGKIIDVYFRVRSDTTVFFTPHIKTLGAALRADNRDQIIAGLIFGAQAILILYNFFLFLSLRDQSYLFYAAYIFAWLLFETTNTGFLARYVLPAAAHVDYRLLPAISFLLSGTFLLFAEKFLRVADGRLQRWVSRCAYTCLVLAVPAVFSPQPATNRFMVFLTLAVSFLVLVRAIQAYRRRRPSAGYFLSATFLSLIIGPLFVLSRAVNLNATHPFFTFLFLYGIPVVLLAEAALFSFALANRYRRIREETELQQQFFAVQMKNERQNIFDELETAIGSQLKVLISSADKRRGRVYGDLRRRLEMLSARLGDLMSMDQLDPDLPRLLHRDLQNRAIEFAAAAGARLEHRVSRISVSPGQAFHLQRFAYECLNNALKHSHGSLYRLRLKASAGFVFFAFADNGKGFRGSSSLPGQGLANLRRRANQLGGRIRILSRPGHGSLIAIRFRPRLAAELPAHSRDLVA